MAPTPRRTHIIGLEAMVWEEGDGQYRVFDASVEPDGTAAWLVITPDRDLRPMSPLEVMERINRVDLAHAVPPARAWNTGDYWAGISETARAKAEKLASELLEMETGDPQADWVSMTPRSAAHVKPEWDPARVPKKDRITAKAKQLQGKYPGVSVPNLHRKLAALRAEGPRGLVHHNSGRTRSDTRVAPGLTAAVDAFVAGRADGSTISKRSLMMAFRLTLPEGTDLAALDDRTIWRALEPAAIREHLFDPAPTRRSKNVRDPDHQGVWQVSRPFTALQLDATDLDVFAVDQYGALVQKLVLVVAVDPFSSKIRAFRIVAGARAFTATTVKRLLLDTVAMNFFDPEVTLPAEHRSPMLATHIGIGTAFSDRGRQFNGIQALAAAAGLQTHQIVVPPGRGDKKPHVESRFNFAAQVAQLLPGGKGANVQERGRHPEKGPLLRVADLTAVTWLLIEGVLHNTPRGALRSPDYPAVRLTPNQVEEQFFRCNGTLERDPDPFRALCLFDSVERVLTDDGFVIDRRTYGTPELTRLRKRSQSQLGTSRSINVLIDRERPQQVIVRDVDGRALVIPQKGLDGPVPVLHDLVDRELRAMAVEGGAIAARDVADLRHMVHRMAWERAVVPAKPDARGPRRQQPPAESSDDLVDVYQGLCDRIDDSPGPGTP